MALGADPYLPGFPKPGIAPPPAARKGKPGSVPNYGQQAPRISDRATQSAVNNQLVAGYGAKQSALSEMTRAGVSRGKGQEYLANAAQEKADADAQGSAARTEAGVAEANARSRQAFETMMRGEGLANAGLLEGLRSGQALEKTTGRGWQQDLYEAMRRGQLGLDQQQLDYTPLLMSLFG